MWIKNYRRLFHNSISFTKHNAHQLKFDFSSLDVDFVNGYPPPPLKCSCYQIVVSWSTRIVQKNEQYAHWFERNVIVLYTFDNVACVCVYVCYTNLTSETLDLMYFRWTSYVSWLFQWAIIMDIPELFMVHFVGVVFLSRSMKIV